MERPVLSVYVGTTRRRLHSRSNAPYLPGMGANQGSGKRSGSAVPAEVETFISRWQGREGGQERANYAMFLTELSSALAIPPPDPASDRTEYNDYVFERVVKESGRDGSVSSRRI